MISRIGEISSPELGVTPGIGGISRSGVGGILNSGFGGLSNLKVSSDFFFFFTLHFSFQFFLPENAPAIGPEGWLILDSHQDDSQD